MAARHKPIAPDELTAAQRTLYDSIVSGPRGEGKQSFPLTDKAGALNGPFGIMLHAPALGQALQELGSAIRYRSTVSARVREVAILLVAVAERSDFEWWAHKNIGRDVGLSEEELDAISSARFESGNPVEQASSEFVAALIRGGELSDTEFDWFVVAIGRPQVLELTILVGYYSTLALSMRIFDVGVPALDG